MHASFESQSSATIHQVRKIKHSPSTPEESREELGGETGLLGGNRCLIERLSLSDNRALQKTLIRNGIM